MNKVLFAIAIFAACGAGAAYAEDAASASPAVATSVSMSTADTPIGDLIDNPASRAVLERHLPEVVASDQLEMALGMTLQMIQPYAPDQITDEKLAAVDADLAALPH